MHIDEPAPVATGDWPRRIIRGYTALKPLTGFGQTRLRELIRAGRFPAPHKLGERAVGWFEDDVSNWQKERQSGAAGRNPDDQQINTGEGP